MLIVSEKCQTITPFFESTVELGKKVLRGPIYLRF